MRFPRRQHGHIEIRSCCQRGNLIARRRQGGQGVECKVLTKSREGKDRSDGNGQEADSRNLVRTFLQTIPRTRPSVTWMQFDPRGFRASSSHQRNCRSEIAILKFFVRRRILRKRGSSCLPFTCLHPTNPPCLPPHPNFCDRYSAAWLPLPAFQSPCMMSTRMCFWRQRFAHPRWRRKLYSLGSARSFYFHANWYQLRRNVRRPLFRGRIISS
jgi:hypothetical protein